MSRYIDAEMLEEALAEQRDYNAPNLTALVNEAMTSAFRIAIREVNLVPTADVEEVKHGQWLVVEDKNGNEVKICSHCAKAGCYESTYEESFDYDYNENCYCDGYDEHREYISTRYCPWCGTKMDL